MSAPRYRVVRSSQQWHVLDGLTVVGVPTNCLLVAECQATKMNRVAQSIEEEPRP